MFSGSTSTRRDCRHAESGKHGKGDNGDQADHQPDGDRITIAAQDAERDGRNIDDGDECQRENAVREMKAAMIKARLASVRS